MAETIDTDLFELIFQLSKSMKDKMRNFEGMANITILQFMTLAFIEKEEILQMKDIAQHFQIEMPTATSLLNKLVNNKLVKRTRDIHDRRIVNVTVSEKGKEMILQTKKIKEENTKNMLSYLSVAQKENLHNILKTLLKNTAQYEK